MWRFIRHKSASHMQILLAMANVAVRVLYGVLCTLKTKLFFIDFWQSPWCLKTLGRKVEQNMFMYHGLNVTMSASCWIYT
jgi:hypothetical protein